TQTSGFHRATGPGSEWRSTAFTLHHLRPCTIARRRSQPPTHRVCFPAASNWSWCNEGNASPRSGHCGSAHLHREGLQRLPGECDQLVPQPKVQQGCRRPSCEQAPLRVCMRRCLRPTARSEEHTSELQSLRHLVCRLLLEIK